VDRYVFVLGRAGQLRASITMPDGTVPASWDTALSLAEESYGGVHYVAESRQGNLTAAVDPGRVWLTVSLPNTAFAGDYVVRVVVP